MKRIAAVLAVLLAVGALGFLQWKRTREQPVVTHVIQEDATITDWVAQFAAPGLLRRAVGRCTLPSSDAPLTLDVTIRFTTQAHGVRFETVTLSPITRTRVPTADCLTAAMQDTFEDLTVSLAEGREYEVDLNLPAPGATP